MCEAELNGAMNYFDDVIQTDLWTKSHWYEWYLVSSLRLQTNNESLLLLFINLVILNWDWDKVEMD